MYTLAQNRTTNKGFKNHTAVITGTGTRIENNPAILKRAKKKVISNALVLAMIDIASANGEIKMRDRYWNTYYCQTKLIVYEGRYYCDYCKNRCCATCCGIRKAHILNKYYPIISEWEEPHLLTITLKAVFASQLENRIKEMIKAFERLKDRCNKRHQRGKGMKIMGVKSLECNFNASKKTYNPHYHIITPNRQTALYIKQEWSKELNKNSYNVSSRGQHLTKIEDVENGLVEVIKYGAKILCDPDPTHKRKRKRGDMTGLNVYANALHSIYMAMDKHRLYGSFGFKLPDDEVENESSSFKLVSNYETWNYRPQQMDWVNDETGKNLTEYEIDGYLEYILKSCIDVELH